MPQTDEADHVVVEAAAPPRAHDALIDAWFVEHFHGSCVARDTETYNHVHRAVQELKARIKEIA